MNSSPRRRTSTWDIELDGFTVIFDACVLYPASLRDLLLELSSEGIFLARWTEQIHGMDASAAEKSTARIESNSGKIVSNSQLDE